ncbi:integrase core domain-containing protein, partial [uncultured Fibrobacter sp.]|uniref:integrase core domain-containing protein n=1 Tax=uncultured Fibrobacter sp. TaxID=261512 RepID=UPI002599D310
RSLDNVYIERFWRTLKYEDVYLKGYMDMKECFKGIKAFIDRYNDRRRHSSLASPVFLDKNPVIF